MEKTLAHKRISIPDIKDFTLHKEVDMSTGFPRPCLMNENGYIVCFEDPTPEDVARGLYRAIFDRRLAHKRNHPEYYAKTYVECSFSEKAMMVGFVPSCKPDLNNFYGASAYSPNIIYKRADKEIHVSYHGFMAVGYVGGLWAKEKDQKKKDDLEALLNSTSIKYIALKKGDEYIFQSIESVPPADMVDEFIRA